MEPDDKPSILSNVNSIEIKVKELEKEKETIQQTCTHKDGFDISFDENKAIKKYCSVCKCEVGYASKDEMDNFLSPETK
jgi:hypothetical protein